MGRWKWFAKPHTEPQQQGEPPAEAATAEHRPAWNNPTVILNRPLLTRGQEHRSNLRRDRW